MDSKYTGKHKYYRRGALYARDFPYGIIKLITLNKTIPKATENIFEGMSQSLYDILCEDEECRRILEAESERIGRKRIENAFKTAEWMSPDEFGEHLKSELKCIFNGE